MKLALAALVLMSLSGPVRAHPLGENWSEFNRDELHDLIKGLGNSSPTYDPARPPYAVFDWDNTAVFLDVEDATTVYMLDNFAFGATPVQMTEALRAGLPDDPEIHRLVDDILASYCDLYLRTRAGGTVDEIKGTPHHRNLRAKFLVMYHLFEERHGAMMAYPWLPFRFTGMTKLEVREVTRQAVLWQQTQPIETVTWTSPAMGKAGEVSITWRNGLRLVPEMQKLFRELRDHGFHVWVCTASFPEGIREIASSPDFGYLNSPERVIGMELESDAGGRFLPQRKAGTDVTYAEGKTLAIQRVLVPRYGYGPALVAGDSNGDAPMMVDFPDTKVSLIVDLGRPPDSPIGQLADRARSLRGQKGARFLLQARDEVLGRFQR